jgi:hypothetical protein
VKDAGPSKNETKDPRGSNDDHEDDQEAEAREQPALGREAHQ